MSETVLTTKRKNGFSWPPDKGQLLSCFFIIYFTIAIFGSFCVSLNEPWSYILGIIFAILLIIHIGFNIWCMAINPGEEVLLNRKVAPQPVFDRRKHKHVIENQFCKICLIVVSFKTKHCRRCNKCINDFDHHCVYLNNCIGGRNYKIFVLTIVSAFIGTLSIFVVGLAEFILSFDESHNFLTQKYYNFNSTTCTVSKCDDKYLPIFTAVPVTGWRAFIMITTILAFIASILIGYLIGYHIFLAINKMSTYEHSVKLKQESEKKELNKKLATSITKVEIISPNKNETDNDTNSLKSLPKIESISNVLIKKDQLNSNFAYTNTNFDTDDDKINQVENINFYNNNNNNSKRDDLYVDNSQRSHRRLFQHRSSHANTGLPCSNSDTQNNYYLVTDEHETSRESFSLTNVQVAEPKNDVYIRRSTTNIVRLPPLMPITNSKIKKSKSTNERTKSNNDVDT